MLDPSTARVVRMMLVGDLWASFHRLWGATRGGAAYDKQQWNECREAISNLLDACGLERRARPRRLHDEQT
jgi:hypothetical protein